MTENDIQRTILDYLHSQGLMVWRHGAYSRYNNRSKFNPTGMPDIMCIIDARLIGFEVKKPEGVISDAQRTMQLMFMRNGCDYFFVTSVDDVKRQVETLVHPAQRGMFV